ncbi:hypothetical protein GGI00_006336, partial [Coemansia sp. RSA 2681]
MPVSRRNSPHVPEPLQHGGTEGEPLLGAADADPKCHGTTKHNSRLTWNELPEWMRDNKFIHTGYRAPTNSFRKCFASLLHLHNESGNIITHVAGALGFVSLCFTVTQGLLL